MSTVLQMPASAVGLHTDTAGKRAWRRRVRHLQQVASRRREVA